MAFHYFDASAALSFPGTQASESVLQLHVSLRQASAMPALPSKRPCVLCIWGISVALLAGAQSKVGSERVPPSPAEQDRLLAAIGQYAEQYVSNLPNFLCEQNVQQFEAGKKPTHWRRGDTLTFRLTFKEGREDHSLELVNDKPIRPGRTGWRTPLITEGEFGLLLSRVFAAETQASFVWSGWEMLHGKTVAVFKYSVAREHSSLKLTLSDIGHAVVPYYGSVYADPASGGIRRITSNASDIPPEVRTKSISTAIDYEEVPIGSKLYLLPTQANVWLITPSGNVRNEIRFDSYRKFETDSTITYTSDNPNGAGHDKEPAVSPPRPPDPR